jgi:hypothetical protein
VEASLLRSVYAATAHAQPPTWAAIALVLVYVLVGVIVITLFAGRSHRTIYDRLAGSTVVVLDRGSDGHVAT